MKPLSERIWPMQQQNEAWFRARAGRPTASQFSRIISPKGKDAGDWMGYAAQLVLESFKASQGLPLAGQFPGNRHTDRGNELEPLAREKFSEMMGLEVDEVGFVTSQDDWSGCSPDGLVCNADGDYVAGLEIKCPDDAAFSATLAHGMPEKHKPQVHGGMAITGLDYWYFVTFQPGIPPIIERIERDDYTTKVESALERFADFYLEVYPKLVAKLKGGEA